MKGRAFVSWLIPFLLAFFIREARSTSELEHLLSEATKEAFALHYGLNDNPLLNNWINRIIERLSRSAGVKVELYILNADEINAYATFGNMVFLGKGLLKMVESEDELACVLAHEVAHIKLRHFQKQSGVIALSLLLLSSGQLKGREEILARFLLALANLGFSRNQEKEADKEGMEIALKSSYNPRGLLDFFRRLGGEKVPRWMEYLSTHPSPSRRLEICEEKMREIPQKEWERIYFSLWERGEAKEAREFPQFRPPPPTPDGFSPPQIKEEHLSALRDRLCRIYPLTQRIAQWQNTLLLSQVDNELFPLIGETLALNNRLKELYQQALILYKNVNILSNKFIQDDYMEEILSDLISALEKGKQGGERLLLSTATLSGLAFSRYTEDLSLISLQALLLSSAEDVAKARKGIDAVSRSLLPHQIEALVNWLNEFDNEWLRRKCSHRLGMPLKDGVPLGNLCLSASISLTLGKDIEEVKKLWEKASGVGEILRACNLENKDKEAIYIFLHSLMRGN